MFARWNSQEEIEVKVYTQKLSAFLLASSLLLTLISPASAQLPPVNWGKTVHGPGDNQYIDHGEQQKMRHPPNTTPINPHLIITGPRLGGGGGGGGGEAPAWRPTPKPPRPDISLQPIPADEPVAPPGFPPLPDRIDLPGVDMTTAMSFNAQSGGGGGGGGAPPPNPFQGSKQGYGHYAPGAFSGMPQRGMPVTGGDGGGGGGPGPGDVSFHQSYGHVAPGAFVQRPAQSASSSSAPSQGSVGYYKCGTEPHPGRPLSTSPMQDTFGSDGGAKPPAYTGASTQDIQKLGNEPKLNDRLNGSNAAPDAPTAVQINQASTQDLSLPDDDFTRRPPNKAGQFMGRQLRQMTNRAFNMMNAAPIPMKFGGGGGR